MGVWGPSGSIRLIWILVLIHKSHLSFTNLRIEFVSVPYRFSFNRIITNVSNLSKIFF